MNIYLRNAGQRRQNSHDFPTGIACAKEPGAEASGGFGIKTGLSGKQLAPQLVKIIAGNGHMGVQSMLTDDGGGELKVLPGVEGFFLGIDAFRSDAHGDQLPGGAAGLGKGLAVSVQSAG